MPALPAGTGKTTVARLIAEKDDAEVIKKRTEAVIQSIDRGYPVLFSGPECSVIVGYADGGNVFLVRTPGARKKGYSELGKWTWEGAGILTRGGGAPTRKQNLRNSLRLAVTLAKMGQIAQFACGFRAYELWAEQLEDDSRFEGKDNLDSCAGYCYANGYMYCVLDAARDSAVSYLNSISGEFEGDASEHLAKAAGLYTKVVETFRTKRVDLPEPWNLFPWDLDGGKNWTREMRHGQARVLREALALERQAIAEIDKALSALQ